MEGARAKKKYRLSKPVRPGPRSVVSTCADSPTGWLASRWGVCSSVFGKVGGGGPCSYVSTEATRSPPQAEAPSARLLQAKFLPWIWSHPGARRRLGSGRALNA